MERRLIGLDLDDVLMDFNAGLCDFHNTRYGTSLTKKDIISYNLEKTWNCEKEEAIRRVKEFYLSPEHDATQPVEGAIGVVKELRGNWDIAIITSRPKSVSRQTYTWLEKNFPFLSESVHFALHPFHNETTVTKRDICQRLGVEVFVDDALFHIEDVASVVGQAFLFDAPWNQNSELILPNIRRINSWNEIRSLLTKEK